MAFSYQLETSGALACFTRPEFKVERLSYEVITPSAARAIFEAIYWRPQIRWAIKEIALLNPISFTHFKRCEIAAEAHTGKTGIVVEKCRQLRSSVVLRNVKYRIRAELIVFDGNQSKHNAMFRRRALKGQCFTQPYFGCREFVADWRLVGDNEELQPPIDLTKDMGRMLCDINFSDNKTAEPKFFRAKMVNGVITL